MTLTNREPADHSDRSSGYVSCNLAGGTGPNNTEMDTRRADVPRLCSRPSHD
jgi:hypothetical protein